MANQLKMADIVKIRFLLDQGWSQRRVARELQVHRETVARYAAASEAKPAISTTGSSAANPGESVDPSPSGPPGCEPSSPASTGTKAGRRSYCEAVESLVLRAIEEGLSAKRIHQDLVTTHGFLGSYESVKRFIRRLGASTPIPFRRMECAAGEEAQVDFGLGGRTCRPPSGRFVRPQLFRIILSFSRKGYTEVVWRQTTEDFIRCLENAFWSFGGVPKTLVIDNLRAGVSQADWYDPTINPKFEAFCRHYGVVVLPAKPYTPRHKGKVEAGVKYAQENAVKAREFASLSEQNSHLTDWERTVADLRIHGTTRRQVRQLFIEQERPKLLPLPADRFPCFQEAERTVHRDGHIEVAKSFYSVPPEFLGRKVWVRWDSRLVTILDQHHHRTIASHVRVDPGRFQTSRQHIPAEKISGVEKGAEHLLERARRIGPESARWAEAVVKARGFAGLRVLPGFLLLGAQYPWRRVEGACTLALSHGEFRLRTLRRLLDREDPDAQEIDFLEAHPIIRNPMEYAPLVGDAFQSA